MSVTSICIDVEIKAKQLKKIIKEKIINSKTQKKYRETKRDERRKHSRKWSIGIHLKGVQNKRQKKNDEKMAHRRTFLY